MSLFIPRVAALWAAVVVAVGAAASKSPGDLSPLFEPLRLSPELSVSDLNAAVVGEREVHDHDKAHTWLVCGGDDVLFNCLNC